MTISRVLTFLVGLPLLVRGVIHLVRTQAAQQSARERGDAGARRAVDSGTARWILFMMPGILLIQWSIHPLTNGRTLGTIAGCAAAYAIAAMLLLRLLGMARGDWRAVIGGFFLSGIALGVAFAPMIGAHGVGYAASIYAVILLLSVGLAVALRRASSS